MFHILISQRFLSLYVAHNLSKLLYTSISRKMEEILTELRELRQIVMSLQPVSTTITCQGVTGKGTQCRNRAVPGGEYCRMHGERAPKPERVQRVKKVPKPKKVQPEHMHGIGEFCMLCDTHGDVLDPILPDAIFEGPDINNLNIE